MDAARERDMEAALLEQNDELHSLSANLSDLDLAFRLQLQEALAASLAVAPSSSSSPIPEPETLAVTETAAASFQSDEIARVQQEMSDRKLSLAEADRGWYDLHRRIHDQTVARQIDDMSDSEWEDFGDEFEEPFPSEIGISCIKEASVFRLYSKGLVVAAQPGESGAGSSSSRSDVVIGLGVAICDPMDNVVFEITKPLVARQRNKMFAEFKALIEGLNAAVDLNLKNIDIYCDYFPLYQMVILRWHPRQRKVVMLLDQVRLLLRNNFAKSGVLYVPRTDIQHAFRLAREAVDSLAHMIALSGSGKVVNDTCVICAEDVDIKGMFSVDDCSHRYCVSCMKQHVEAKLLHGMLPKCPHEGCKSDLGVESCQKFLTPKLIETLRQRIKEASIPVSEKVYCPYPRCSALMSRAEISEHLKDAPGGSVRSVTKRCLKCQGLFCINCKVPWHSELTCLDYKRLNPGPPPEDVKLKSLARVSLWRQCLKCNHMIELSEGCYHMTCRCGYEFCYNCGAEWKDKKATCSCPLWEEDNIWSGEDEDDFEEEVDDDYTDSEYGDYL